MRGILDHGQRSWSDSSAILALVRRPSSINIGPVVKVPFLPIAPVGVDQRRSNAPCVATPTRLLGIRTVMVASVRYGR